MHVHLIFYFYIHYIICHIYNIILQELHDCGLGIK